MALAGPSRSVLRGMLAQRVGLSLRCAHTTSWSRPTPTISTSSVLLRHLPLRPFTAPGLALFSTSTARFPRATPARPVDPNAATWMRTAEPQDQTQGTYNKYGRREPLRSWWRPIVFTLGFSYITYIAAATWTNMDAEEWMEKLSAGKLSRLGRQPSDQQMVHAKRLAEAEEAKKTLKTLPSVLSFLPTFILVPVLRTYIMYKESRINSPSAHRAQIDLIMAFSIVFACWKLRTFQPLMARWFVHNPIAWTKRQDWMNSFTMLTSTFSHQSLAHFAFNSIALYSFGTAAYMYLATPEPGLPSFPTTSHMGHFFAFFAVAGVFSGLGSHLVNNLVRLPRLIRALRSPAQLSPTHALAAHNAINPSLGASGAVYACLTVTALAYPDTHVSLIFLPMLSIPMPIGVLGMVMFDIVGLVRGWRYIDHIAHLAGAVFGVFYYFNGKEIWAWIRLQCDGKPRTTGFF